MRRLQVVVTGVVVSLILFFIAVALGADLQIRIGSSGPIEEMTWVNVVIFTLVAGLLAWGLAALLDRVRRGRTIFTVVALFVLVVSFAGFTQLDLDTAGTIWQGALHLTFGVIIIIGFWVTWPMEPALETSGPDSIEPE